MIDSSRVGGVEAVEAVLALRALLDSHEAAIDALEDRVMQAARSQTDTMDDVVTQLKRAREKHASVKATLHRKSSALGITQRTKLVNLMNDEFVRLRMNAYLMKQRIRDRLRQRKFELRHREQSYRDAVNGTAMCLNDSLMLIDVHIEQKLNNHVANSVKHREPAIQRLVKSYNAMCTQMRQLAPRRAYLPCPLDMSGLYKMDVDDVIWHDAGLGEETDGDLPRWMCDENVRKGIKCLLELDRCIEEEHRLQRERCIL
jgi:hypothetical protein